MNPARTLRPWSWTPFGFVLILVPVFSLLALGLAGETHDPVAARDFNALGKHACPGAFDPSLQHPWPPSPRRPDEAALWNACLAKAHRRDQAWKANFPGSDPDEEASIARNQQHYRVEVRRTIRELELGHPLYVPSYGLPSSPHPTDEATGLPECNRGCEVFPDSAQFAHDLGRRDTLEWFAERGTFAVNSSKGRS